jgi:tryptophan synthase alpha chain
MSRIPGCFEQLQRAGRRALIPFITAGDPEPARTVPLLRALVRSGADLIELGVPFSDPMADGPVIQRSSERALKHGVSLRDVLAMVAGFRRDDATTPVILMGYLNPIEHMGYEAFARAAQNAGVDGVLVVDLPAEEAGEFASLMRAHGLDQVFLLAPTTSDERLERICQTASGFLYYVSLKGVTGSNRLDIDEVAGRIARIRGRTRLPLGVGFGIKDPAMAARVARFSDAVIVGSALVERMAQLADHPERIEADIGAYLKSMRLAMDAA